MSTPTSAGKPIRDERMALRLRFDQGSLTRAVTHLEKVTELDPRDGCPIA
jgi:hypothetical protein